MSITINLNTEYWRNDFQQGVKASFKDKYRALGTLVAATAVFLLTIFSANPGYSVQMISAGMQYWGIALITRTTGLIMNTGYTGLVLTIIFSGLAAVTMTNTLIQLNQNRVSTDALGILPGFLAGGCASCGVGVLTLLGFGGILASLPYQGNLLRLAGVILLTALITKTGNPETCKI